TRCSGESRRLRSDAASLTTLRDLRQHFVVIDLGLLRALVDSTLLLLIWGPWSSLPTSLCSSPTWDDNKISVLNSTQSLKRNRVTVRARQGTLHGGTIVYKTLTLINI